MRERETEARLYITFFPAVRQGEVAVGRHEPLRRRRERQLLFAVVDHANGQPRDVPSHHVSLPHHGRPQVAADQRVHRGLVNLAALDCEPFALYNFLSRPFAVLPFNRVGLCA